VTQVFDLQFAEFFWGKMLSLLGRCEHIGFWNVYYLSTTGNNWIHRQHDVVRKAFQTYESPQLTGETKLVRSCFGSLVFTTASMKKGPSVRFGRFLVIQFAPGYTDNYLYLVSVLYTQAQLKLVGQKTFDCQAFHDAKVKTVKMLRKLPQTQGFIDWYEKPCV
jgi:hypothetical protein